MVKLRRRAGVTQGDFPPYFVSRSATVLLYIITHDVSCYDIKTLSSSYFDTTVD